MPASTSACICWIWATGSRTVTRSVGCFADLAAMVADLVGVASGVRHLEPTSDHTRTHVGPFVVICLTLPFRRGYLIAWEPNGRAGGRPPGACPLKLRQDHHF